MEPVSTVVKTLLDQPGYTSTVLGADLGVSAATVDRWMAGTSEPRAAAEGRLRKLYESFMATDRGSGGARWVEGPEVQGARQAINRALAELREALHRRGRLSSRNEALDEASVLLFAHAMLSRHEGAGICAGTVAAPSPGRTAEALRTLVSRAVGSYLPASLASEMGAADFALRLKPTEDALAADIIAAFEELSAAEEATLALGAGSVDLLNEVFGNFLADSFVDEKELGQYLTPVEVVQFMVQLAIADMTRAELDMLAHADTVAEFGLVLDPSCGVGSFLAEFVRTVRHTVGREGDAAWLEAVATQTVMGIDKSERMTRLALANMAMFGAPSAMLHCANSLDRSGPDSATTRSLEGRAGLILTNPPFGAEFRNGELADYRIANDWARRSPASVDSELLFIERYLDWLRPEGQLLAIVPDSVLTNKNLFEDLRRGISPDVELRSIISLPSVTFASAGTTTKTSVLHLRKRSGGATQSTRFAICQEIGYAVATRDSHRRKVKDERGELPRILDALTGRSPDVDVVRTVDNLGMAPRWDATYHASLPAGIQSRLASPRSTDLRLKEVAELSTERTDPRRLGTPTFRYIEISDVDGPSCGVTAKDVACDDAPSRARRIVRAGDVLVSTVRPERRTIGVVPADEDGSVCTTGFAVVRPLQIDPLLLAILLQSDFVTAQLLRNNVGIAYPAIEESCLEDVLLPLPAEGLGHLGSAARQLAELEAEVLRQRAVLVGEVTDAAAAWARN